MKFRRLLLIGSVLVAAGVLFALAGKREPKPMHAPLPERNGHDRFLAAVELLQGDSGAESFYYHEDSWGPEELLAARRWVGKNEAVLAKLEEGVALRCVTPLPYGADFATDLMPRVSALKRVGRLAAVAGRVAEVDGRYREAAEFYALGVTFGAKISDGLLIHRLVGIAVMAMHLERLEAVAPQLDRDAADRAIQAIEAGFAILEPPEATVERDMAFMRQDYRKRGLFASLSLPILERIHKFRQTGLRTLRGKVERQRQDRDRALEALRARVEEGKAGRPGEGPDATP